MELLEPLASDLGRWYPDPLEPVLPERRFLGLRLPRRRRPPRQRWWDGATWTTRILVKDEEGLSWTPELLQAVAPGPATATAEVEPLTVATELPVVPAIVVPATVDTSPPATRTVPLEVVISAPDPDGVDPLVAAFGADALSIDVPPMPRGRIRRTAASVLLAASLGALVAGSSAAVINRDRPTISSATTYTDTAAGFTLQYPAGWHVQSKVANSTIRFIVGTRDAALTQTNTVSVLVSSKPAPLGTLDMLASQVPGGLRAQFPGVRLETAEQTKMLGGPAFHLRLAVSDEVPTVRVEQYVGTTTAGRTLTVTVTVREPRTAPRPAQIQEFLHSIEST
jgi:hypothetical protein